MHVGLGETDAVVLDAYHRTVGVQADTEGVGGCVRLEAVPGGQRVRRVLQEFAQVDAGAGVEVVGEEVDEAAQIHLEGAVGGGRGRGGVGQSHQEVRKWEGRQVAVGIGTAGAQAAAMAAGAQARRRRANCSSGSAK